MCVCVRERECARKKESKNDRKSDRQTDRRTDSVYEKESAHGAGVSAYSIKWSASASASAKLQVKT